MPVFGARSCLYSQCTQESLEFLYQCIDGLVPLQVGGQPETPEETQAMLRNATLQDTEENYALNIQETDFAKLADFTKFLSFGIRILRALRQAVGIACLCHTIFINLQKCKISGAFL